MNHNEFTALIGAKIAGKLREQGLNQQDLALRLGVTQQSVSKRINGRVPWDVEDLMKVAEMLGLSIGTLIDVADVKVPETRKRTRAIRTFFADSLVAA